MNWLEIEQLLNRYIDGDTSLAEEKQLKAAFLRSDVPKHLSTYSSYFGYVKIKQELKHPNENLEAELIDQFNIKNNPKRIFPKFLAYAATLALLISSLFFLLKQNNSPKYEAMTAKEMEVAQKYLALLANNMDHSLSFSNQHLEKIKLMNKGIQTIERYENSYKNQIEKLNNINYLNQSITKLKPLSTFETGMEIIAQ